MPIYPAIIGGHVRVCDGTRGPCVGCTQWAGSRFGGDYYCVICAQASRVSEQYATRKAVAR